ATHGRRNSYNLLVLFRSIGLVQVALVGRSPAHEVELVQNAVGDCPCVSDGVHVARNQVVVVTEVRHAVGPASRAIEKSVLIDVAVEKTLLVTDLEIGAKEPDVRIIPAFEAALEGLVKIRTSGLDCYNAAVPLA